MVDRVIRIVVDSSGVKKGVTAAKADLGQLEQSATGAGQGFALLKQGIIGIVASLGVRQIIQTADAWQQLNGQLKLVTDSQGQLLQVQQQLFDVAQATRQPIEATADLYTRLARSTDFTSERVINLTDTISKAIALSRAAPESARAALFQLGQGFASGALRGEELNSVLEQTPELARAIANGLGVTIGELRKLGAEGKLTAELVATALEASAASVNEEFGDIPLTVGDAVTQVRNASLLFIGTLDDALGATSALAKGLNGLAIGIQGLSIAFNSSKFGFGPDADLLEKQINDLEGSLSDLRQIANGGSVSTGPGQFSFRFIDPAEAADAKAQIAGIENAMQELKRIQLEVIQNGGIFPDPAADAARAEERAAEVARLAALALEEQQKAADELVKSFQTSREKAIEQLALVNAFIAKDLINESDAARVKARLDDMINPLEEIKVTTVKREIDELGRFIIDTADNAADLREQLEAFATGGQQQLDATIAFQEARDILADYNGEINITVEELAKLIATEKELQGVFDTTTGAVAKQVDAIEDFKTRARENSQDILAGFLESGLQDLDNFERAFADMLLSLASQALAAAIFDKILGPQDGAGGGGLLGTAVDFFGSVFGGGQFGRGVQAGQAVMVGEGGRFNREAFVPNQGGSIVPLNQDRGEGGGGAAPVVNNTIVNTIEESDITGAFQGGAGDSVLLNRISVKRTAFRRALGV